MNKKPIYIFITLIIFVSLLFVFQNNKGTNDISDFDNDVDLYNQIIRESTSEKDTKKCDDISSLDVIEVCKNTIKSKFDDMSKITTVEWCDTLEATQTESKEFRQDVCRYNKMKPLLNEQNYIEYCEKINNIDIKNICINENKSKYDK